MLVAHIESLFVGTVRPSDVCFRGVYKLRTGVYCRRRLFWGPGQSIFLAFDINWPLPLRVPSRLGTSYGARFASTSTLERGAYMHRAFVPRKIIFIRVLKDEN